MNQIPIHINGSLYQGKTGETILELARRNKIEIPTLCHDPRLEPYSSCYLCVVEVDGMRGLQPSCSTRITEGMQVVTDNEKIKKARKTALDLLVSNHYADCVGPCKLTCPAGVDVQGYISLIEKGLFQDAVALIKEVNPLPAICGRVCVRPCEVACRRNLLEEGAAVGVDYLKRFAADFDLRSENPYLPNLKSKTGKKVAVIGSGPGGLSVAYFLQKEGHQCDIYEASPAAGGMLRYGIPEYRLPNDLLQKEVENITRTGVNIYYKQSLGKNLSYRKIRENYDAMVLTIGSQKGTLVGVDGDDAENVLPGIDFLRNMAVTNQTPDFRGKTVAVVGGGNTAMDCCRSAIRCGAEKVYVIYRRTEKEMPANPIEIHESKLEGVEYLFLTNPQKINKDEAGKLKSVTCIRMELGEPDASGRRKPVPVPDSAFDLPVDYILAAIGQKTNVDFLNEVNQYATDGQLKINKWGNLEANPNTLQTGIASVFAAGDGVTGPATIIEAIAQSKKAALSCHQFLSGLPLEPAKPEFFSRRDNFTEQKPENYKGNYGRQRREEMPVLDAGARNNFQEVELGYPTEEVAKHEAERCLECGCSALYTCDLKKYAGEYGAEQKRFTGDFQEFKPNYSHPFIEIDNNKCILCSRCIRVCSDIVGASALGLVNRGFDTFVAPALGANLAETDCESCGLCISTCPTGAITENYYFKPGPLQLKKDTVVCNYCSLGCEIDLHHQKNFVMQTSGSPGPNNPEANICRKAKFGYRFYNRTSTRIKTPLQRIDGKLKAISYEEAYALISRKIKKVQPDQNLFMAGARLTNEEQYLIQKLARAAAKTNNVSSFSRLQRLSEVMMPLLQRNNAENLQTASHLVLFGVETNRNFGVLDFQIQSRRQSGQFRIEAFSTSPGFGMKYKVDEFNHLNSYYHFIKAMNYYLLQRSAFKLEQEPRFRLYLEQLRTEYFETLLVRAGQPFEFLENLVDRIIAGTETLVVVSELELGSNALAELNNLQLLADQLAPGKLKILALPEKNNSTGLIMNGNRPSHGPGNHSLDDLNFTEFLKKVWKIQELSCTVHNSLVAGLENGEYKNLLIFGEDPAGTAIDRKKITKWLEKADFVVVQDHFLTDSCKFADLILPGSFAAEDGGSYLNHLLEYQEFDPALPATGSKAGYRMLLELLLTFNLNGLQSRFDIHEEMEILRKYSGKSRPANRPEYTENDDEPRLFRYGCDVVEKDFCTMFETLLKK